VGADSSRLKEGNAVPELDFSRRRASSFELNRLHEYFSAFRQMNAWRKYDNFATYVTAIDHSCITLGLAAIIAGFSADGVETRVF
jgi:hypothetical protein